MFHWYDSCIEALLPVISILASVHQISGTFCHGPNVFTNILNSTNIMQNIIYYQIVGCQRLWYPGSGLGWIPQATWSWRIRKLSGPLNGDLFTVINFCIIYQDLDLSIFFICFSRYPIFFPFLYSSTINNS